MQVLSTIQQITACSHIRAHTELTKTEQISTFAAKTKFAMRILQQSWEENETTSSSPLSSYPPFDVDRLGVPQVMMYRESGKKVPVELEQGGSFLFTSHKSFCHFVI